MVVGAVDLEGADEVAQGGADKLLVLGGLVEVGDVELEVVDLGHVEAEGLVVEVAVGDGEDELANMDAAGEMERTVVTDCDLVAGEAVGVDDDHLAVGDDEGVDAADDEVVVGEVEACVGAVGGGLEVEGVVVVALVARVGFLVVDQLVLDLDAAGDFVVGDQAVLGEVVNHEEGLRHVEADAVGEALDGEVGAHGGGVLIGALDGANIVDTLDFAVFLEGIEAAGFEGRHADGAGGAEVGEEEVILVEAPGDGLAVDVEAVVGVDVGAVEVALGVVDERDLAVGGNVADVDAGVADGVFGADIEGNGGILGDEACGGDGELE